LASGRATSTDKAGVYGAVLCGELMQRGLHAAMGTVFADHPSHAA
jgi:hypothetical protein